MTVNDSAYIIVLENKLAQAERNLYEFRQIFTHWQQDAPSKQIERDESGLFPGQLRPSRVAEEEGDLESVAYEEAECLE